MSANYLIHHGISGQKWGERNGPPYPLSANAHSAAEKRAGTSDWSEKAKKSVNTKKVVATAAVAATGAAIVYANRKEVAALVSKAASIELKNVPSAAAKAGEKFIHDSTQKAISTAKAAGNSFKDGVHEGVTDGVKKGGKTVTYGLMLMGAKEASDIMFGKEDSARIFQANNSKKISNFWKVSNDDREDD